MTSLIAERIRRLHKWFLDAAERFPNLYFVAVTVIDEPDGLPAEDHWPVTVDHGGKYLGLGRQQWLDVTNRPAGTPLIPIETAWLRINDRLWEGGFFDSKRWNAPDSPNLSARYSHFQEAIAEFKRLAEMAAKLLPVPQPPIPPIEYPREDELAHRWLEFVTEMPFIAAENQNGVLIRRVPDDVFTASMRGLEVLGSAATAAVGEPRITTGISESHSLCAADSFADAASVKKWLDSRNFPRIESLHACYTNRIESVAANTTVAKLTCVDLSPTFVRGQLDLIRQDINVVRGWALSQGLPDVPPLPPEFKDREEGQAAFTEWCCYLERSYKKTQKRLVWDLYPLAKDSWGTWEIEDDEHRPDHRVYMRRRRMGDGCLSGTLSNELIGRLLGCGAKQDDFEGREGYVPTDDDIALLKLVYPDTDPYRPAWYDIKAELIAAGHDADQLGRSEVPVLLTLLRKARVSTSADTVNQAGGSPPAEVAKIGLEAKQSEGKSGAGLVAPQKAGPTMLADLQRHTLLRLQQQFAANPPSGQRVVALTVTYKRCMPAIVDLPALTRTAELPPLNELDISPEGPTPRKYSFRKSSGGSTDDCAVETIIYGDHEVMRQYGTLSTAACRALGLQDDPCEWTRLLFRLAWQWKQYPGTVLKAEKWTVRDGVRVMRPNKGDLPEGHQVTQFMEMMLEGAEPFTASTLDDLFSASVAAIDLFLTVGMPPECDQEKTDWRERLRQEWEARPAERNAAMQERWTEAVKELQPVIESLQPDPSLSLQKCIGLPADKPKEGEGGAVVTRDTGTSKTEVPSEIQSDPLMVRIIKYRGGTEERRSGKEIARALRVPFSGHVKEKLSQLRRMRVFDPGHGYPLSEMGRAIYQLLKDRKKSS